MGAFVAVQLGVVEGTAVGVFVGLTVLISLAVAVLAGVFDGLAVGPLERAAMAVVPAHVSRNNLPTDWAQGNGPVRDPRPSVVASPGEKAWRVPRIRFRRRCNDR